MGPNAKKRAWQFTLSWAASLYALWIGSRMVLDDVVFNSTLASLNFFYYQTRNMVMLRGLLWMMMLTRRRARNFGNGLEESDDSDKELEFDG
jgi:hypothetical protein